MVAILGKSLGSLGRAHRALAVALLGIFAAGAFVSGFAQQTSMDKRRELRRNSPFNLGAGPSAVLQANLVQCGITNEGQVCTDVFDSPTGGGGFWPSGTTNQYIFNSGLQLAGINAAAAGPWANDTVGAYFFDARGTQAHGDALSAVFNSLDPNDINNWPADAFITDTSIFNAALIGSKNVSDQDSYTEYWDGNPDAISQRSHPMGVKVQQRSLAFNAPSGAEHTVFFIYKFTNVTNDPEFQTANEAKFRVALPDAGWTITNMYAGFAMDPDVTTHATDNFSTAFLPLSMGVAYHARFETDDFNFAARSDLYAPPFFAGPGFVGVKYLKSPINPATGREVGLTMFSNTTNPSSANSLFPDPLGVRQLFRYMKGDVNTGAGDPPCSTGGAQAIARRLCAIVQGPSDTRFYQASGPFSLAAGQSATIVVGYTHGAPVNVGARYNVGDLLPPGTPARVPGFFGDSINTIDRIMGLIQIPAAAVRPDTSVDQSLLVPGRDVVPRSLLHNGLIAQTIFNNKFLLPRPPEPPAFALVPGDNRVTVIWEPSPTDVNCVEGRAPTGRGGDPYFNIASDPASPLFDPNYRRCDVEGYRVYRATGLGGGFELVAQFDKTGTAFTDVTCATDPSFVPAEGACTDTHVVPLAGDFIQHPAGSRFRDAATGAVIVTDADTTHLEDTGVAYAFVDQGLRNGVTYRYIVTAFDVNSLQSGQTVLESARVPKFVTPRKDPSNLTLATVTSSVSNAAGQPLPTIALPTVNAATGIFSGPMPPTNGLSATFAPVVERLMPAFNLSATIDSIIGYTEDTHPTGGCPKGSNFVGGGCWQVHMTFNRDGTITRSVAEGYTPIWSDGFGDGPVRISFPLGSGAVVPSAEVAAQFGLPANFPGFVANINGEFPQTLIYSQMEGQTNRRDAGNCTTLLYPGFGCGNRHVSAGSRWFSGANETVADPARLIRVGNITGVDSVWAPIHHTPVAAGGAVAADQNGYTNQYPASAQMQCFSYMFSALGRAADVRFTWGANGAVTVTDVSHNTPVIFKPNVQVSYGFMTDDANGNGVIDWADFNYVGNVSPAVTTGNSAGLACGHTDVAASRISLKQSLTAADLRPVSLEGTTTTTAKTPSGTGFGLYVNGERYIFRLCSGAGCAATLPASGQTWTLRTYNGLLRTGAATTLTEDPSGYTYWANFAEADIPEPRQPMVTGVRFNASAPEATALAGDVDITRVHTVPDPYYVRSAFELGPANKSLRFVNLPSQAVIRIYSLNGTLVRVLEHNDPLGGAEGPVCSGCRGYPAGGGWDLRNRNDQFVASGVYFFVVEGPDGKKHTGKFTIVQFAQ